MVKGGRKRRSSVASKAPSDGEKPTKVGQRGILGDASSRANTNKRTSAGDVKQSQSSNGDEGVEGARPQRRQSARLKNHTNPTPHYSLLQIFQRPKKRSRSQSERDDDPEEAIDRPSTSLEPASKRTRGRSRAATLLSAFNSDRNETDSVASSVDVSGADDEDELSFTHVQLSKDCQDPNDKRNYILQVSPFDPRKFTWGASVYDQENLEDAQHAAQYAADIFQRLYLAETRSVVEHYMDRQSALSTTMRTILVDWFVDVHRKFRLSPESLYLSVNILDRYLSSAIVSRSKLQLVGVTALLIASKYEDIYPPEVRDCVYMTDRAFTAQDVLDTEVQILETLGYMISAPTAFPFLQRFLWITQATCTMKFAAAYYCERVLQEYEFITYRPSLVAAAAVCLALNHDDLREYDGLTGAKPGLPQSLMVYTGFVPGELAEVVELMAEKVAQENTTITKRSIVAVKRKYSSETYQRIATNFSPPDYDCLLFE